ncbi:hypothetical protein FS837_000624 [Tulasnella sp. UAMH 9824]|nr:hypothetical protein FS837_000624 [Tulasnella sp. UAMH 9824]
MKVLAFGASRNVGYYASIALLKSGHSVVFQLRKTSVFDQDEDMKPFIQSGAAKVIQGDAMVEEDVRKAWTEANADNIPVDVILFTRPDADHLPLFSGGTPKFMLSKGFIIDPPNICSSALLNVLSVIPRFSPQPRLIALTSNGVTSDTHKKLPLAIKASYAMIQGPHADKLGWAERLGGKGGWLRSAVVVRPAVFTDGPEKGAYRVGEEVPGLWTVS